MKTLKYLFVLVAAGCIQLPAPAQTTSNTLVRFRFSIGNKAIGEMVVELFDQQKPITVNNFLNYVRSGRYGTNRTILHRTFPGAFIQGGVIGICNPYISTVFSEGLLVPTDPPITNETGLGPLLSNTFGTIAMATDEGNPHSATSSWFFNTANNVLLNTNNGGYCVFGRVKTGSDFLKKFNTTYFQRLNYYINVEGTNLLQLPELPVPYRGAYAPYYSELFLVDISLVTSDAIRPTIAITSPAPNPTITEDSITVSGTATDTGGFGLVETYLNLECPMPATGTTSWSASLTNLSPGTNLVVAQSTDASGNKSAPAYRSIFRSVPWPLALNIEGAGTVSGATNGQLLEIYRRYVISAMPAPGNLFAGWTGGIQQATLAIGFYMETNFTLTAKFVTNGFPRVKGVYTGLFRQTNIAIPTPNSSGMITITIGDSIGWSGKVFIEGRSHPISGLFDPYGNGYAFIDRRPYDNYPPFLSFKVNLDNPDGKITGEIRGNGWTAEVQGYRTDQHSTTSPSPFLGKYTWVLPGGMDPDNSATGEGYGTVSVDSLGKATFAGALADGTRLTQRSALVGNGKLPLFLSQNSGKGMAFGWLNFDRMQPLTDFTGDVTWSKPVSATSKYNKPGFTNTASLAGSRWVVPADTTPASGISDGMVEFSFGNLAASFINEVAIGPNDKVTNGTPSNRLVFTIARPTGLFSGSVTPPGSARSIPFKGAMLQKSTNGFGSFLDTNRIGRVVISPDTP